MRFFLFSVLLLLMGCSASLLPTTKQINESPWATFEDGKKAFDLIIPNQTNHAELLEYGFDPFTTPNVKLITYLDLINKFLPNPAIQLEHLDESVKSCLEKREACYGYEVTPNRIKNKRYGNVFLDLFNFKRKTKTTGWRFSALIVLKNGVVVYKLWGGEPNILQREEQKNPLGPLQELDSVIRFPAMF